MGSSLLRYFYIIFVFFISGCMGCQETYKERPSYRMLDYKLPKKEIIYQSDLNISVKEPRTIQHFNQLKDKARKGDVYSHYLLYLIYFDDSNCSVKKRVPDENCLLAINYLNNSIELQPDFEPALYHLAILNKVGIGMDVNLENSIRYYQKIIDLNGRYRGDAIGSLVDIYLYNKGHIDNRVSKAKFYIDMGAKEDCFQCLLYQKDWLSVVNRMNYLHQLK